VAAEPAAVVEAVVAVAVAPASSPSAWVTPCRRRTDSVAERPHYTEIDHTADVGVELRAHDLVSAFERTAACMFDLICHLDEIGCAWSRRVTVRGRPGDVEHLMVRWLSELLYLSTSSRILLSQFKIEEFDLEGRGAGGESSIVAEVHGERMDAVRHSLRVEIKAPTYHSLRIEETPEGWAVRVIFDT